MEAQGPAQGKARRVSFKSVALPAEHGSWSLVLEPILLGLLVAPSVTGAAWAASAFLLFMAYRPLTLAWGDRRRGRSYERTRLAWRYGGVYLAGAAVCGLLALLSGGWRPLLPLPAALPFLIVFLAYDQRPGRSLAAELAAPGGFAAVVAVMAMSAGWELVPALALWGTMIARATPAVLYVRARLKLDKGKVPRFSGVWLSHLLAIAAMAGLAIPGLAPWSAAVAMVILLGRAIWGLSAYRWPRSVKGLGILEIGFGLLTVLLIAAGYWLNL